LIWTWRSSQIARVPATTAPDTIELKLVDIEQLPPIAVDVRLLTTRGGFQDRLVNKIAEFLRFESDRSSLTLRADPWLIAYAIVRTTEGFLYNDAVAAVEPRFDDARDIVRLILD
jgi:Tetracyclin repressor-like, C-terminal domain